MITQVIQYDSKLKWEHLTEQNTNCTQSLASAGLRVNQRHLSVFKTKVQRRSVWSYCLTILPNVSH